MSFINSPVIEIDQWTLVSKGREGNTYNIKHIKVKGISLQIINCPYLILYVTFAFCFVSADYVSSACI